VPASERHESAGRQQQAPKRTIVGTRAQARTASLRLDVHGRVVNGAGLQQTQIGAHFAADRVAEQAEEVRNAVVDVVKPDAESGVGRGSCYGKVTLGGPRRRAGARRDPRVAALRG
jgi:hypothetical protein